MSGPGQHPSEFYVGYLSPPPPGIAKTIRRVIAGLAVLVVIAGGLIAVSQRSPGRGVWNTTPQPWTGLFSVAPYPMLRLVDPQTGELITALLVREGKCGLMRDGGYCGPPPGVQTIAKFSELLAGLDGRLITLTATDIRRDGHLVLEVLDTPRAAPPDEPLAQRLRVDGIQRGRPILLSGEIVDPKCFYGAMKPGDGAAHRGCATLCISGGIPPVLAVRDRGGRILGLPIIMPDGSPANALMARHAGDLVDIGGTVEDRYGLRYLRFDGENLRRR